MQQLESAEQGRRARWTRSVIVALSMLAACTEPVFVLLDGGDVGDGPALCEGPECDGDAGGRGDAMSTPGPGGGVFQIPEQAKDLSAGSYAMRIRHYGTIAPATLAATEVLALGKLVWNGTKLQLTMSVCKEQTEITPPAPAQKLTRTVAYPGTVRVFNFSYPERYWQAETPEPELIGYSDVYLMLQNEIPVPCEAGKTAKNNATRHTWLSPSDDCQCEAGIAVPLLRNDCRLADSDNDRQPGITMQWSDGRSRTYVAIQDRSKFVHGVAKTDLRHFAEYEVDMDWSELGCVGSTQACAPKKISPCSPADNAVDFVPAPEGQTWQCSNVEQAASDPTFFPVRDGFPSACIPSAQRSLGD